MGQEVDLSPAALSALRTNLSTFGLERAVIASSGAVRSSVDAVGIAVWQLGHQVASLRIDLSERLDAIAEVLASPAAFASQERLRAAIVALEAGLYPEAADEASRAIDLYQLRPRPYLVRGVANMSSGNPSLAFGDLDQAVRLAGALGEPVIGVTAALLLADLALLAEIPEKSRQATDAARSFGRSVQADVRLFRLAPDPRLAARIAFIDPAVLESVVIDAELGRAVVGLAQPVLDLGRLRVPIDGEQDPPGAIAAAAVAVKQAQTASREGLVKLELFDRTSTKLEARQSQRRAERAKLTALKPEAPRFALGPAKWQYKSSLATWRRWLAEADRVTEEESEFASILRDFPTREELVQAAGIEKAVANYIAELDAQPDTITPLLTQVSGPRSRT